MNTSVRTATSRPAEFSVVRAAAKSLHGMVAVWTTFCGLTWLLGLARLAGHGRGTETIIGLAAAVGTGFWGFLWIVGVIAGELVAIGLATVAPRDAPADASRREWGVAALVSAGVASLLVVLTLLTVFVPPSPEAAVSAVASDDGTPIRRTPVTSPVSVYCGTNPYGLQFDAQYAPSGTLTLTFRDPLPSSKQIDYVVERCNTVLRLAYQIPDRIQVRALYHGQGGLERRLR